MIPQIIELSPETHSYEKKVSTQSQSEWINFWFFTPRDDSIFFQ